MTRYIAEDYEIEVFEHNNKTEHYEELFKELEITKFQYITTPRKNNILYDNIVGHSLNFGCGNRHQLGFGEFLTNKKYSNLYELLKLYGKKVLPDDNWDCITVNKNVQTKPHFDKKNSGRSYILFIGNFTGGELVIHKDDDIIFNTNNIIQFNGCLFKHSTNPFIGTRYSIIYYSSILSPNRK